ncbi:MAG: hypothetical protein J0M12_12265 [Deltaproteobacteria bacterium]|nr:hypothetical protein [Deltaproteobacteria bacterium]
MSLQNVEKTVRDPQSCQAVVSKLDVDAEFRIPMWLYRYRDNKTGWVLSIATHAEPNSQKYSLGGFRIAPAARAEAPGYDNDAEAIGLGVGMDEKVYWSRLIKIGGTLGLNKIDRIVGGKCVLLPSRGSRVGEQNDFALLDFALACLKDFEETSGIFLTTGQDLGHGILSDGKSDSIQYMYERFRGSIVSDTSQPTAAGNYFVLSGALQGLGIKMEKATIGLHGCGNIGIHLLERLRNTGATLLVCEFSEARRAAIQEMGIQTFSPEEKMEFLSLPMDALAVNANGASLDSKALATINENPAIEFICGCENLAMPVSDGAEILRQARKMFCPTELCGMMGYLTAVEEYHSRQAGKAFKFEDMFKPAEKLEEVSRRAAELVLKKNFACGFDQAVRELYMPANKAA